MLNDTTALRQSIIDGCLWMGQAGLNQGTSGNISVRVQDGVLITPSATPYAALTPDHIVKIPLDGTPDATANPSTEWPFHTAVLRARPAVHAVVHAHPAYATAVATQRRAIPAVHYMVAAFGGADVPCTGYATYGTRALSDLVVAALADRDGCLMANHGALTLGASLDKALWRMQELENLARVLVLSESSGTPVLLSESEIQDTLRGFATYGLKAD